MASISASLLPQNKTPFSSSPLKLQTPFPKCPSSSTLPFPKGPSPCRASCSLIPPDGGRLVNLIAPAGPARDSLRREAAGGPAPRVPLSRVDLEWVHVLSEGWASPLEGFMRESEFLQALHFNSIRCGDGSVANMSVPVVLAVDDEKRGEIGGCERVVLVDGEDRPVAILNGMIHKSSGAANRLE